MSKARKSFPLRLDHALYEALEHWAAQELRSVNGQIEFLLRQAVNKSKRGVLPRSPASDDEIPPADGRRTVGS